MAAAGPTDGVLCHAALGGKGPADTPPPSGGVVQQQAIQGPDLVLVRLGGADLGLTRDRFLRWGAASGAASPLVPLRQGPFPKGCFRS